MSHKRLWTWLVLMVTATTLLAACGRKPAQTPPTTAPVAAGTTAPATTAPAATDVPKPTTAATEIPTAAAPAAGGALKILYAQAITVINPYQSTGTKDLDGATVIFEPLARYNQNDELVPYLAEEIPTLANGGVAKDNKSITWKLKKGVKWSDGTPFTADDVIFTWQYCADPGTACVWTSVFANVDKVEAVDPTTVKVTWKKATANPYSTFVSNTGMIIQKAQFANCVGANAVKDATCQKANLAPIGTNAYKLKEFKPGDTVIYEKNPNYRDAANTFFDTVEIKGGGDSTSAARAVCETGEVDYAWNLQVPAAVLTPILAAGKCDTVAGGSFGVERININFANPDPALGDKRSEPDQPNPILSDLKVRQAIAKAIDRKPIAEQLYGPAGSPTCNISVVPLAFTSTDLTCERDVEGAKKLLDAAGWLLPDGKSVREKNGKPLKLTFQTSINTIRQGVQAIVKTNLADVGIQVDLKAFDAGVFFGSDPGNPDTLQKFYSDLQMYTNTPSDIGLDSYFQDWTCANVDSSKNQWKGGNDTRYCSKDYDALFKQFTSELDPTKRAELAKKLNDFLVNDVVVIPLINRMTPNGKLKTLDGPTYQTFDSVLWNIQSWKRTS